MNAITFDTLKYANTLKSAGVAAAQAEAQAEALADILEINLKELATKGDLVGLEQRLEAKMIQLEQRMTIKLGTMLAASVGMTVALMKLL